MLGSLELFCAAAELESFAAAAHRAGVTPAAVSRSIARLEARLGVTLFARSTRQIRLNDHGRAYYLECRRALDWLIEAERALGSAQVQPGGSVRISLPTPLGHQKILPILPIFRARYPDIRLDIHLSNRNVDFIAEGFDLAVRGRAPPDSRLIARRLIDDPLVTVGSAAYVERHGAPTQPEELLDHDCIQFILPSTGQRVPWLYQHQGKLLELATDGSFSCSDDLLGTITLARHGGGLLQVPRFMVEEDLDSGRLVEVLRDFAGPTRPFSLIYPADRHLPRRVRVLIDFLIEAMNGEPPSA